MTFLDLINQVKHEAIRDQSSTQFDTPIKNAINWSLFRINRDAPWRVMRRKTTIDTVTSYTTGSGGGTFTSDSKNITLTGATLITDGIKIGRRITLQGSSKTYTIKTITGETTATIDIAYDGDTITGTGTFEILPQEEYNLPVQVGHRMFMWHEFYGFPVPVNYITDQDFYENGYDNTEKNVPALYRMWGEDMAQNQPIEASVATISSSSSSDTNINITIFGIVSGYPDYEQITTNASNGTTAVNGSKQFTSIERVVADASRVGRITVTTNSANVTIAVIPVGDTTEGYVIRKIQLSPLPNKVMPINVQYYKDADRLVNSNDVHELGKDFDRAIVYLSVSQLKIGTNQDEADKFFALYKDELKSLKKTNMDKIDFFPKLKRPFGSKIASVHPQLLYSQAGAYYGPAKYL